LLSELELEQLLGLLFLLILLLLPLLVLVDLEELLALEESAFASATLFGLLLLLLSLDFLTIFCPPFNCDAVLLWRRKPFYIQEKGGPNGIIF